MAKYRILSLDGGGLRGLITARLLARLNAHPQIAGWLDTVDLFAGTSTGGMTGKRYGRVGDAPIIGAGTYANDRCGVSATGWGEFYIRATVAHDICARVAYAGDTLATAAHHVVNVVVPQLGGDGGVIALDAAGNYTFEFNSPGMYRAARLSNQPSVVAIYGDEATR